MILDGLKYLLRFIALLFAQVLIVDKLGLGTSIKPYIYVVFILMLPVRLKAWKVLLIACFTGLIMDTFSYTPGMHMAASVFMAYFRSFFLKFSIGKDDFESNIIPNVSSKGWVWFSVYAFILTGIHHTILFYLEIFGFHEFFGTLWRIICSTVFSCLILLLGQLLFYKLSHRNG